MPTPEPPTEQPPAPDLAELLAAVKEAREATKGQDWRERAIVTVLATLLTTGSGAAVVAGTIDWIRKPPAEFVERLDKAEAGVAKCTAEAKATAAIARETFEIVNAAHPPLGRVGVPDPQP